MENPKELRLGNVFIDNKTNELLRVCKIDEDDIGFAVIDRSKYPLPDGWQAEPIPLTPEWLERCGFKDVWLEFNGGDQLTVHKDGTATVSGWDSATSGQSVEVRCKYLHQLQNLYFALTGEELTINNEHLQSTS